MRITMSTLAENAGTATGDFVSDIAGKAADAVCEMYRDYAGNFLQGELVPPAAFIKGTWDSLCNPRSPGLPPPPTMPFTGGQCCDVDYKVVVRTHWSDGRPDDVTTLPRTYQGTVLGLRERVFDDGGGGIIITELFWRKCDGRVLKELTASQDADARQLVQSIERVYPAYGVPDTCGNPPPSYPNIVIPKDKLSPDITYTYNDGVDLTMPLVFAPITANGTVNIDVGGLTFKFDAGGVNIDLSGDPPPVPPGLEDKLDEIQVDINNVGNTTNNINNTTNNINNTTNNIDKSINDIFRPMPPAADPNLEPKVLPGGGGGVDDNMPDIKWLTIELTKLPEKAQFGTPTVFFAGWVTFIVGGDHTEREQINFKNSVFRSPAGATGYGVTFTNKAQGVVTAFTSKKEG